jgi:hypothetical protein
MQNQMTNAGSGQSAQGQKRPSFHQIGLALELQQLAMQMATRGMYRPELAYMEFTIVHQYPPPTTQPIAVVFDCRIRDSRQRIKTLEANHLLKPPIPGLEFRVRPVARD